MNAQTPAAGPVCDAFSAAGVATGRTEIGVGVGVTPPKRRNGESRRLRPL